MYVHLVPPPLSHTHTYIPSDHPHHTRTKQAAQQLETRKDLIMLSTGSSDLDKLLGGAWSRTCLPA